MGNDVINGMQLDKLAKHYYLILQKGHGNEFGLQDKEDDRSKYQVRLAQEIAKRALPFATELARGSKKNYAVGWKIRDKHRTFSFKKLENLLEEDLIAEGMLALVEDLRNYNPVKGYFKNFMRMHLLSGMAISAKKYSGISRLPSTVFYNAKKIIEKSEDRESAIDELVEKKIFSSKKDGIQVEEIAAIVYAAVTGEYVPINSSADRDWVTQNSMTHRGTLREVSEFELPEEMLKQSERKEKIDTALQLLKVREREILRDYFGFNGDAESLEKISLKHGVTRERIRQIKFDALETLRLPGQAEILEGLI
jgi:RNA polymerase sigma factor (sigma-70 family)